MNEPFNYPELKIKAVFTNGSKSSNFLNLLALRSIDTKEGHEVTSLSRSPTSRLSLKSILLENKDWILSFLEHQKTSPEVLTSLRLGRLGNPERLVMPTLAISNFSRYRNSAPMPSISRLQQLFKLRRLS